MASQGAGGMRRPAVEALHLLPLLYHHPHLAVGAARISLQRGQGLLAAVYPLAAWQGLRNIDLATRVPPHQVLHSISSKVLLLVFAQPAGGRTGLYMM